MWIEIFKSGDYRDGAGNKRHWSTEDLDHIAMKYDPANPAPVVIGHPKDNAPAFGWVEDVKREGEILFAKLKGLVPEFVDLLKRKMYRNRSISLYPDMTLRHVGFLGAVPPAVKGLADIAFSAGEAIVIDDSMLEAGDGARVFSEEEVESLIEKARQEGAEKAESRLSFEFGMQRREDDLKRRKEGIKEFIQVKVAAGILPPCLVDFGLIEFMENIETIETTIEFSEGREMRVADWFREFLDRMKPLPIFGEAFTKKRAGDPEAAQEEQTGQAIAGKVN